MTSNSIIPTARDDGGGLLEAATDALNRAPIEDADSCRNEERIQAAAVIAAVREWDASHAPAPAQVAGWVACSERMPETDVRVIMLCEIGGERQVEAGSFWSQKKHMCNLNGNRRMVTHWMPLPSPPETTP